MEYIISRSNFSCTIFVPWDCKNNCPFCTSKQMYKSMSNEFNLDEILNKISILNKKEFIKTFVLTGGEPLSNLTNLKAIINACEKPIYINTSLPKMNNIDDIIDYVNYERKIIGLNISRHLNYKFDSPTSTDEYIEKITKPIRINSILPNELNVANLLDFVIRYGNRNRIINLREDYRFITTTTLKDRNETVDLLADIFKYVGNTSCLVCNTEFFDAHICMVCYHRGMQYSSYKVGNKCYLNDVLITPNGKIYEDWDFTEENDEFKTFILE